MEDADGCNSRESARLAGWGGGGDLRPKKGAGKEAPTWGEWLPLLGRRRELKWSSFSWLTVRALFGSINDVFAKFRPELIEERRSRWLAAQRGRRPEGIGDLVIDRSGESNRSFFLVGDTGEQDASQYALAPLLSNGAVSDADTLGPAPEFLLIASDVIYPAGDVNEYVNGFYIPYEDFKQAIYALPGNHDWYDGLNGFMYHFCGAEPLPPETFRSTEVRPGTRLAQLLWRGAGAPRRQPLSRRRAERPWGRDATGAVQPAPYFAIDLDELLLVCIDTGVNGAIDEEQALWLVEVSRREQQKVLVTGKPIYVDNAYHPGAIAWNRPEHERPFATVDEIVRDPAHRYIAAIGGDVHNYQRYPIRFKEGSGEAGRTIHYLVSGGGGAYLSPTHRIPPIGETPESEHEWPAGELEMPADEECFERMPEPETPAGDPSAFRCYPRRGDSLAYAAHSAGPRIFVLVQLAATALLAAATMLLYALPLDDAEALGLTVLYGWLAFDVLAYLAIAKLSGGGVRVRAAIVGFAALAALGLIAFAVDSVADHALLADPRFWGVVGVALLVPLLILGTIVWAHDLRGSTPASLPELGLSAAIAAAIAIQWQPGAVGAAPGWFVTTVAVLAILAAATAVLGFVRRRGPDWTTNAPCRVVYDLALALAPAALAASLALNTDSDRIWLLGCALVGVGAWPFALAKRRRRAGAPAEPSRVRIGRSLDAAAAFLGVAAWVTAAIVLLHMVGDGWIAIAATGTVAVLVAILVAVMLAFLALGSKPLKGRVLACLGAAVLLVGLGLVCWPLYVAAAPLLLGVAWWSVYKLRAGTLNADAAATEIRGLLPERRRRESGEVQRSGPWKRNEQMPGPQGTLFKLLYPYEWEASRRQGAARSGGLTKFVAKLIAELGDVDEPPFFKHLLRLDIGPRTDEQQEDGEGELRLTIRCYGVTGYATEERKPPLEDEIEIPFRSRGEIGQQPAPAGSA